jgi:radical SAM superfamily enzyme YgiQ (UPF0313 family)
MKVVLINPLFKDNTSGCKLIPLGLAYLHAAVRNEHDVEIINLDYDNYIESIIELVVIKKIDVCGFTIYEGLFTQAAAVARFIKRLNPKIIVIAGGPFATYASNDIICNYKQFDFAILGEGERSFRELLLAINSSDFYFNIKNISGLSYLQDGKYCSNPIDEFNADEIPIPSWDAMYPFPEDNNNRLIPICTSRGCWGNCTFCSFDYNRSKRIKSRSLNNVREEIELLISKYEQHDFFFSEPNFLYSKTRTIEFIDMLKSIDGINSFGFTTRVDSFLNCKDLIDSLVNVGCRSIELGVESGSDSQLLRFKKGTTVAQNVEAINIIKSLKGNVPNFVYCLDLILFDPYCTSDELIETINFMYDNQLNSSDNELILYNAMNLFQGTEIRRNSIADKLAYNSIELPYYEFLDSSVAKTYSYMILFMNKLQPLLKDITKLFNEIFMSTEYESGINPIAKIKIGKQFYKRSSIVFDFLRDILLCKDDLLCYNIYIKYENTITGIRDSIVNLYSQIK